MDNNLPFLSYIHVPGPQAEKFLQGQVTCDVREVTEENSLLGAHCDPKGRVQFIFRLFKSADSFYLQLLHELVPHAINLLQKYAQFFRIQLTSSLRGPVAAGVPSCSRTSGALPPRHPSEWKLQNIEQGIPTIYPETIGLFTPHQINLQLIKVPSNGGDKGVGNAVSFTKGCYTGQEIVARMQHLGKLKQRMYRVSVVSEKNFIPGAKLYNDANQEVGELVDSEFVAPQNLQALVVLNDNAITQPIHIENPTGPILTLLDLPYTR